MTTSTRFSVWHQVHVYDLYRTFPNSIPESLREQINYFLTFQPSDPNQLTLDLSNISESLNDVALLENLIQDFNSAAPSIFQSLQAPVTEALDSFTDYANELLSLYLDPPYETIPQHLITPIAAACRIRQTFRNLRLIESPRFDTCDRFSLLKNPPDPKPAKPTRPDLLRILRKFLEQGHTPQWYWPTAKEQDSIYQEARSLARTASTSQPKAKQPSTELFQFS